MSGRKTREYEKFTSVLNFKKPRHESPNLTPTEESFELLEQFIEPFSPNSQSDFDPLIFLNSSSLPQTPQNLPQYVANENENENEVQQLKKIIKNLQEENHNLKVLLNNFLHGKTLPNDWRQFLALSLDPAIDGNLLFSNESR